jgi:hypothetical protein
MPGCFSAGAFLTEHFAFNIEIFTHWAHLPGLHNRIAA